MAKAENRGHSTEQHRDSPYIDSIQLGITAIYHYRFSQAETIIERLEPGYKDNYLLYFLKANYLWWHVVSGNQTDSIHEAYYGHLKRCLELLKQDESISENERQYASIIIYAFQCRISLLNDHFLKAYSQFSKALSNIKKTLGRENEYPFFYLTSGIYNYFIESGKKNYPYLIPYLILLPKGDMETGIAQLKTGSASGNEVLSTESTYFLSKIYLEYEFDFPNARNHARMLNRRYPENLLFRYLSFKSLLDNNESEQAMEQLKELKRSARMNPEINDTHRAHFDKITTRDLVDYQIRIQQAEKQ